MTPTETEVRVLYAAPDAVSEAALAEADTWLRPEERARLIRLRAPGAARLSRIGRALARRLLADRTGTSPLDWWFAIGRHGRPEARCARRLALPPPSVNVSHCASLVCCALADRARVGIDVEPEDRPPPERRPERFLAAAELAWLASRGDAGSRAGFWRLWTLKEAWLKARGTGIAGSLRSFAIRPGEPSVLETAPPEEPPTTWAFLEPATAPGHRVAVAVRCAPAQVRWWIRAATPGLEPPTATA